MKHPSVSRLVLAALMIVAMDAAPRSARAQQPVECPRSAWLDPPDPALYFYPARKTELWVDMSYLSDWNPRVRVAIGPGFEWVFLHAVHQRVRFSGRIGFQGGHWGDDDHGIATVEPSVRFRGSFYMDPLVDIYVLTKAGLPFTVNTGPLVGVRSGIGAGVRFFRGLQFEATFDPIVSLGREFNRGDTPSPWSPGLGLSVGLHLCVFGGRACNKPAPQTKVVDQTCKLYAEAQQVCQETAPTDREILCKAVEEAMNESMEGSQYAPGPGQDSANAFLVGVVKELQKDPQPTSRVQERINMMIQHHQALEFERKCDLKSARFAAQEDRKLEIHHAYAPYPVSLRRALGCDPDEPAKLTTCPNVCEGEVPAAK